MESITKEIAQQLLEVAAADRSALLAENAQLKASNEQLRAELTNWRVTAARGHDDQCNLGALCPYCQIDKLKAQVESLKADGERLDWLEAQAVGYGDGWTARMSRTGRGFRLHETRVRDGVVCSVTARLAIDLARKAKGE